MNKTEARNTLLNAGASEADKAEARKVLGIKADGSEDMKELEKATSDTANTKSSGTTSDGSKPTPKSEQPGAGTDTTKPDPATGAGPGAATGVGLNNADGSNMSGTQTEATQNLDSFPNTGDSANLNKPAMLDAGAASAAAATAGAQRFRHNRPPLGASQPVLRRNGLTGEVDSATTATDAEQTAVSNAAHATQRFVDNRGYSNFREVPAPNVMPTMQVPVSNMVQYIDEHGIPIGSVERGSEAGEGEVIVIGGKEWVIASPALGSNQNSIAVRQNLPQPIN